MQAVIQQIPEHWLEERHRLGQDRRDELWEGVLHMVPPPSFAHQAVGGELYAFLLPLLRARGIGVHHQAGLYRPGSNQKDYRVPDLVFYSLAPEASLIKKYGIEGAAMAVAEIRSPDDESYEKFPFYASLGVREVFVIHPDTRVAEVHRLVGPSYLVVGADEQGRVHAETIDARFRTVSGPQLRVECAGESRDV
ncbi:MAG TPA: Uma2 family endonuclease [Kofleriaceae bacterium]|nr:Uma2 family endonuclease [Kofleriaceae bacterium]